MNGVNHKVEFLPKDVLQLPSNDVEQRQDRQGSLITDKDPSYIQPNEASYSELG